MNLQTIMLKMKKILKEDHMILIELLEKKIPQNLILVNFLKMEKN